MRRFLLTTMIAMLVIPMFYFSFPSTEASSDVTPFSPHEVKVLVVSPANLYLKGGHYLISDLAGYGFNVTQHISDNRTAVDYRSDPKTADLSQYDVVILHGSYIPYPPIAVTIEEVNHFTNYGGILIAMGNALFWNETTPSDQLWGTFFGSTHNQELEQRLGVDFIKWLRDIGATEKHNNGRFTLTDDSISGLPSNLTYVTHNPNWINYQVVVAPREARKIYDFTTEDGITTGGVTYYENATGAVGIYIQGSYIYSPPEDAGSNGIRYFGLTDISKRSSLLASLIAHALGADINTVIKPQPLATIRLDQLGGRGWGETYLNTSLFNFNSLVDEYGIMPTIAFTDFLYESYWQNTVPNILSQLRSKYRDWEYASSLRNEDLSSMTQSEIELLIKDVKANYTALEMDLFSTVATFARYWNQTIMYAMASENLTLLDMSGEPEPTSLEKHYLDWWNLRVDPSSEVIVHSSAKMGWYGEAENFTQMDSDPNVAKNKLHYEYFRDRDKWALAAVNGFPSFVYSIWHFRQNEVGTYSLKTVYANLTSEIPGIQFVPLVEAGLYFGNKWVRIENSTRAGSTIEFDLDSSAIPDVLSIGKGMLWLRINTNQTIREVLINDEPWHYFDDYTIRIPADSVHVKVMLGERIDPSIQPRVIRTVYKVTKTSWGDQRFSVSVSATPRLNVSIKLSIPLLDAFSSEALWGYTFDASLRLLEFWAVSDEDGLIVFDVGADVTPPSIEDISHSSTSYNTSVTVNANITDLNGVENTVLSYSSGSEWINVTMVPENDSYVGVIPAFPFWNSTFWNSSFRTVVRYRLYASDVAGNWRVAEIVNYTVTDKTRPEIGTPEWDPLNPSARQPVLVRVSVSEPENASQLDLDSVTLWYYLDGNLSLAKNVSMTHENGLWRAEVPGQRGGREVSFFIRARDKAGNVRTTEAYSYKVGAASVPPLYLLVAGLALTSIGIGAGLYFAKFRKAKKKKN